ncbi:MAG: sugar phosphate isomerase/epimerase family protein [Phycisphaerae bacterium]
MLQSSFCTIAFQDKKWAKDVRVERPLFDILPTLAEAGYDAAEIWAPHAMQLEPEQLVRTRGQMDQLGIGASLISPYFDFTTSSQTARDSLGTGRRCVEIATVLGASGIRCFTGKVGSAEATERQWDLAVANLQKLAALAEPAGLFLACETHSRNLMDTPESAKDLMQRVDRPNVGLIFQPGTFGPETCYDALDMLWPWTRHVHANNRKGDQPALLADGDIDYRRIFQQLRQAGVDGYVSIEWMGDDVEQVARAEAAWLAEQLKG